MKNIFRKSLVIGIVILFLGAVVIPVFYGKNIQYSPAVFNNSEQISDDEQKEIIDSLVSMPLFFTENRGQFPAEVLFQTHVSGSTIYLCKNSIISVFTRELVEVNGDSTENNLNILNRMRVGESPQIEMISVVAEFVDANPDVVVTGEYRLSHNNNYFIGNDSLKWYTDVPNYQSVIYQDLYPGVDLTYYGYDGGSLKYDFIVQPGADVSQIQVHYKGVDDLSVDINGALVVGTRFGVVSENTPFIYQDTFSGKQELSGRYIIYAPDVFGFEIDDYDPLIPLVIDPTLLYSKLIGGSSYDYGISIATDSSGNAYVTGYTQSIDFPMVNPFSGTFNGGLFDVFVSKLDPSGSTLLYSTYIGGFIDEVGCDIFLAGDAPNCWAYVTGYTNSEDFPMKNEYQVYSGGYDAFVFSLLSDGNILKFSTFLGGQNNDYGWGIQLEQIVDYIYVAGTTKSDYFAPGCFGTLKGSSDVFVARFYDPGFSKLLLDYCTYFGGSDDEECRGIWLDWPGQFYIAGTTESNDFYTTLNAYKRSLDGFSDIFVSKFDRPTTGLLSTFMVYSTYLGGNDEDQCRDFSIDLDWGLVYVTGMTLSSSGLATSGAYQTIYNGDFDAFVSKLNTTKSGSTSLVYSTYLGGSLDECGWGVMGDIYGIATVIGYTASTNFPISSPLSGGGTLSGITDGFVSTFSPDGDILYFSTYLGGSEFDNCFDITLDMLGNGYITGLTGSPDFPIGLTAKVQDVFMVKLGDLLFREPNPPNITGQTSGKPGILYEYTAFATDPDGGLIKYYFDWGDGNFTLSDFVDSGTEVKESHAWNEKGQYTIKAKVIDQWGAESEWATLLVSMRKSKAFNTPLFLHRFFQRFPFFEKNTKTTLL